MSDAQEKLNEIDAMLYTAGFGQPNTIEKVKALIGQHKANTATLIHEQSIKDQAIRLLEHGYVY